MLQADFGERLAHARSARGYPSQAALARALGVSPTRYNVWETGQGSPQTIGALYDVCQLLGVTSDYLLFGRTEGLSREAYEALVERNGDARPDKDDT